jgi:predicted small secreted protein
MAAESNVSIICEVTGLGQLQVFAKKFGVTTTPTRVHYQYMIQAVADTGEVLDVGDVGTVHLIVLKCIANDVDVDTSYVSSFSAEIEVQEGEVTVFKPTGTVWIKNNDSSEQSTIEYLVIGSA